MHNISRPNLSRRNGCRQTGCKTVCVCVHVCVWQWKSAVCTARKFQACKHIACVYFFYFWLFIDVYLSVCLCSLVYCSSLWWLISTGTDSSYLRYACQLLLNCLELMVKGLQFILQAAREEGEKCTSHAHHMHITCTSQAHHMHITCTSHAHHMHITGTSHARHMHTHHMLYFLTFK